MNAAEPKPRRSVGLSWDGSSTPSDELVEFRQALLGAGAHTAESSHGATKSVYGVDPDGNPTARCAS